MRVAILVQILGLCGCKSSASTRCDACTLDGRCVAEGAVSDTDACRVCDTTRSRSAWSISLDPACTSTPTGCLSGALTCSGDTLCDAATDNGGNITVSPIVAIKINPPSMIPPTANLLDPTDGDVFTVPAGLTLAAFIALYIAFR